MSKTGKKLKSVNCDSIDLTYNEIYDVFIDSGLSYEQCVHSSFQLQDIADDELASGNYNIITAKTFCVWDREKPHE